jgi:hypothetical protein
LYNLGQIQYIKEIPMGQNQPQISMTREEILQSAANARVQEIMHYQINIDNYTLALEEISQMSSDDQTELSEFTNQLSGLLATEKLEQKKAKIMLAVLQKQVD